MLWEHVSPNVRRHPAPAPRGLARSQAYALDSSEGYILVEPVIEINPGDEPTNEIWKWVEWVREYKPLAIVCTHWHIDHWIGILNIQRETGIEVWGPPTNGASSPIPEFHISRVLRDDDLIGHWQIVDCPGHALCHIALFDGRSLVCGDAIAEVALGDGKPEDWLKSQRKLVDLRPQTVLSAHGNPILNGKFSPWMRMRLDKAELP